MKIENEDKTRKIRMREGFIGFKAPNPPFIIYPRGINYIKNRYLESSWSNHQLSLDKSNFKTPKNTCWFTTMVLVVHPPYRVYWYINHLKAWMLSLCHAIASVFLNFIWLVMAWCFILKGFVVRWSPFLITIS